MVVAIKIAQLFNNKINKGNTIGEVRQWSILSVIIILTAPAGLSFGGYASLFYDMGICE